MKYINPSLKLIGLIVVTFVLAWWHESIMNLTVFGICLVLIFVSGAKPKTVLLSFLPILVFAVGMFMTGYRYSVTDNLPVNDRIMQLADSKFWNGMVQASRVLAYAGVGFLFAFTTDRMQMIKSFERQLHLPQMFAYGVLAAWGIFPQIAYEFKKTRAGFRARGLHAFPLSPAVLKPMLVKAVRWSEELAIAMESKGFSGRDPRTDKEPVRVHFYDWIFLALCVVVFPVVAYLLCHAA